MAENSPDQRDIPLPFRGDIQLAQDAVNLYFQGSVEQLDLALAAWDRITSHAHFPAAPLLFQLRVVNWAAGVMLHFLSVHGNRKYLDLTIKYLRQAVSLAPPAAPVLPQNLVNLGICLDHLYDHNQELATLEEAVQHIQDAISLMPPDSPDLPEYLNSSGTVLHKYYQRTQRLPLLEDAVRHIREAASLTLSDAPSLPVLHTKLSAYLAVLFHSTKQTAALEEAIRSQRQAIALMRSDAPDLPEYVHDLGVYLQMLFRDTRRLPALEEAISSFRQAVSPITPGSPHRPIFVSHLSAALYDLYLQTDQIEPLEEAFRNYCQVVPSIPPDSDELSDALDHFLLCLDDLYARTKNVTFLEEAVDSFQQAAGRVPDGSPILFKYLRALAHCFGEIYSQNHQSGDLKNAVSYHRQALELAPADSKNLPEELNKLGNDLSVLYDRTGQLAYLEESSLAYEQALHKLEPDAPSYPLVLANRGKSLLQRYVRNKQVTFLEEAIAVFEQAESLPQTGAGASSNIFDGLGIAYHEQYLTTGRVNFLEKAIRSFRQVISSTQPDAQEPNVFTNLGHSLLDLYYHDKQPGTLEEAINNFRTAVSLVPIDSYHHSLCLFNLGNGLRELYEYNQQPSVLAEVRSIYRQACEQGATYYPEAALKSSRNWCLLDFRIEEWEELIQVYAQFTRPLNDQLISIQPSRSGMQTWLSETSELPSLVAYAYAKLNRLKEAVETLENGRAQLLAQALEQNRRDLQELPLRGEREREIFERHRVALAEYNQLLLPTVNRSSQWLAQFETAQAEVARCVAEIRTVNGFENFLLPVTFDQIAETAQPAPLIYLLHTSLGGLALIVLGQEIELLWLPELNDGSINNCLWETTTGYLRLYHWWRLAISGDTVLLSERQTATQRWMAVIEATLQWLWESAMGEVVEYLQARDLKTAVLIPAGQLALLPLHAAWTKEASLPGRRQYGVDQVSFSYVPSAKALHSVQPLIATPTQTMLAIENPDRSLRFADEEIQAATRRFHPQARVLKGSEATLSQVLANLPGQAVVHFSTHGSADLSEPLQGGLQLAQGETLTLQAILDLRLPPFRLAVLSACETGIPGTKLPDEVISLPSGFIQAGAAGVLGSLWAVSDISSMLLMAHFYELWLNQGYQPSEALRQAQIWLRDSAARQMNLDEIYHDQFLQSGRQDREAYQAFRYYKNHPEEKPFTHPYFWAAFTFSGV